MQPLYFGSRWWRHNQRAVSFSHRGLLRWDNVCSFLFTNSLAISISLIGSCLWIFSGVCILKPFNVTEVRLLQQNSVSCCTERLEMQKLYYYSYAKCHFSSMTLKTLIQMTCFLVVKLIAMFYPHIKYHLYDDSFTLNYMVKL